MQLHFWAYKEGSTMNGKINIIFGFFYFAFTAVLGPALLVPHLGKNTQVMNETAQAVDKVRTEVQDNFKGVDNPDAVIAPAVVSIFDYLKVQRIAGKGAHSHGNLEALLNIVVGFILLTLAIPSNFKALLSLLFLLGAVFHSGMLYLGGIFGMAWAYNLTTIGAIAIIAGLVFMGVAAITGIKQSNS